MIWLFIAVGFFSCGKKLINPLRLKGKLHMSMIAHDLRSWTLRKACNESHNLNHHMSHQLWWRRYCTFITFPRLTQRGKKRGCMASCGQIYMEACVVPRDQSTHKLFSSSRFSAWTSSVCCRASACCWLPPRLRHPNPAVRTKDWFISSVHGVLIKNEKDQIFLSFHVRMTCNFTSRDTDESESIAGMNLPSKLFVYILMNNTHMNTRPLNIFPSTVAPHMMSGSVAVVSPLTRLT